MRAAVNFEAGNIDEAIGEFRKAIAIAGETGSQRLRYACVNQCWITAACFG
jgi:hypothetical protein